MNLQKIMHHTIELPLDVHLPFATMSEIIQAQGVADVDEYRLYNTNPAAVGKAPLRCVDLMLHGLTPAPAATHSDAHCMPLLSIVYMLIKFEILFNANVTYQYRPPYHYNGKA